MIKYKGIILAGGLGTRLYPMTLGVSKQLLPIYDKPLIYYSMSVFLLAGIKNILLISTPKDLLSYKALLGDGSQFGVSLHYEEQKKPEGLAQAFLIGEEFIGQDNVSLVLGDNIFYGKDFPKKLQEATAVEKGATIFAYKASNPTRFGVIEFNNENLPIGVEEKPSKPKSNYAVTGLYFYDNSVVDIAKSIKYSKRGELEITDINNIYIKDKRLNAIKLDEQFSWLDTGTFESMLEASRFAKSIEDKEGHKVACLEEIAYSNGWISLADLTKQAKIMGNSDYGKYLEKIIQRFNES